MKRRIENNAQSKIKSYLKSADDGMKMKVKVLIQLKPLQIGWLIGVSFLHLKSST